MCTPRPHLGWGRQARPLHLAFVLSAGRIRRAAVLTHDMRQPRFADANGWATVAHSPQSHYPSTCALWCSDWCPQGGETGRSMCSEPRSQKHAAWSCLGASPSVVPSCSKHAGFQQNPQTTSAEDEKDGILSKFALRIVAVRHDAWAGGRETCFASRC